MKKLGFSDRWRSLIMLCISLVTYYLKINGMPRGCTTPTGGLHQGDPLSPYLFLICVEELSALIKKSIDDGVLHGV